MFRKLGGGGRVEVINDRGCSKMFMDFSSSFRGISSSFSADQLFPASPIPESPVKMVKSNPGGGPFSGLVICVTGLSKETRKQVKEATERLGGRYSPHLHPQCTHLVVQSFHGLKFEHALKHGPTNGLLLVTIGWFVDSAKRNVRLNESLYSINNVGDTSNPAGVLKKLDQNADADNHCLPPALVKNTKQTGMMGAAPGLRALERESKGHTTSSCLSSYSFYIDVDVPPGLRSKVAEALSAGGATLLDKWFVGCNASHVVCEGPSVRKYLGHSGHLVTPLWVLKSANEKCLQRLVHLSSDLARHTGAMLDTSQIGFLKEEVLRVTNLETMCSSVIKFTYEERQMIVKLAKEGVRERRNRKMQTCQTPIRPITPRSLLDSICWSVSEPTSTASIYTDSSSIENGIEDNTFVLSDAKEDGMESQASFVNLSRPLTERERSELIFKGHFLTILFPVDRFSEIGPSSRTFFSSKGFTCMQVLDHVYAFYQENMSTEEIEVAIHMDSRHADRLRSAYASKGTKENCCIKFKRIDFLGSRKSFEMLKRMSGDNCSNAYELLIRA